MSTDGSEFLDEGQRFSSTMFIEWVYDIEMTERNEIIFSISLGAFCLELHNGGAIARGTIDGIAQVEYPKYLELLGEQEEN